MALPLVLIACLVAITGVEHFASERSRRQSDERWMSLVDKSSEEVIRIVGKPDENRTASQFNRWQKVPEGRDGHEPLPYVEATGPVWGYLVSEQAEPFLWYFFFGGDLLVEWDVYFSSSGRVVRVREIVVERN